MTDQEKRDPAVDPVAMNGIDKDDLLEESGSTNESGDVKAPVSGNGKATVSGNVKASASGDVKAPASNDMNPSAAPEASGETGIRQQPRISVVIPILNAEKYLPRLFKRLLAQTVEAEIIVIDSGSKDNTVSIVRKAAEKAPCRIRLIQIPGEQFDHGGTRDYALRQSGGDYVMFLTQDALPVDKYCIENLLKGFSQPDIAGVYGRQIAWPDAAHYEKLTRQFNYPDQGRVWREQDIPRYGVKSYFFSNTCSMYRRDIYEKAGGFDRPIITNEDMMMAARLIHQGYALAYVPEAAVYHSHNNTLFQDYKRNVKIGYVMRRYSDRLTGAQADSEGMRMVRFVGKELIRERHFLSLGAFCMHAAVKLAGNRAGKARRKREEKKEN